MLFLDGVYVRAPDGSIRFHRLKAPTVEELQQLLHTLSYRIARFLERRGLLERDAETSYLHLDGLQTDDMPLPIRKISTPPIKLC